MDIADFFHLQASLKADRIVNAAPDKENILRVSILAGKPLDTFLIIQCFLDLLRQPPQLSDQFFISVLTDEPFYERHLYCNKVYGNKLRTVCFRCRH